MGFFPLRVKIVYCGVSQPSLRQGAIGNSFARNNICKDGFLMQTRICFPIAAGKVETLFLYLMLQRFLSPVVIRTYSFKTQYWNSISQHQGRKKEKQA